MALGIKQRLLAYHIERRDTFRKMLDEVESDPSLRRFRQLGGPEGSDVPLRAKLQESHDLHADAIEFLTEVKG